MAHAAIGKYRPAAFALSPAPSR